MSGELTKEIGQSKMLNVKVNQMLVKGNHQREIFKQSNKTISSVQLFIVPQGEICFEVQFNTQRQFNIIKTMTSTITTTITMSKIDKI